MAGRLRHEGANASAPGSGGGGRFTNTVSNSAVQSGNQNISDRTRSYSKMRVRVPALSRQHRHKSATQSRTECSVKANRFSVASRFAKPCWPCPKLCFRCWTNPLARGARLQLMAFLLARACPSATYAYFASVGGQYEDDSKKSFRSASTTHS